MKLLKDIIIEKLRLGKDTKIDYTCGIKHISWPNLYNWFCMYDVDTNYINHFKEQVNNNGDCYWIGVTNEEAFTDARTFRKTIKHLEPIIWGTNFDYTKEERLKDVKSYFPHADKIFLASIEGDFSTSPFVFHIQCKNDKHVIYVVGPDKSCIEHIYKLFVDEDDWSDVNDVEFLKIGF